MTLLYTIEETPSCKLKLHSVKECNKKQSSAYVLIFKINFKIIENKA